MRLIIRKIVNEDFDYNENQNGINSANEFINYKKTDEACGQISPDIEKARSALKKTGTDTD